MGLTTLSRNVAVLTGLVLWTFASGSCRAESFLYAEDFDNLNGAQQYVDAASVLGNEWTFHTQSHYGNQAGGSTPSQGTNSSRAQGRARIYDWGGSRGGVLVLDDDYGDNIYSLTEAVLQLDLQNQSNVTLTFDHYDADDENHAIGTNAFVNHKFADGVAVSSDGSNWVPLVEFSQGNNTWREYTANISDLVASSGLLSLTSSFLIKFQQYDNYYHGYDGRKFDDILLTSSGGANNTSPVPEPATATLFGFGLMGMAYLRRRKGRLTDTRPQEA